MKRSDEMTTEKAPAGKVIEHVSRGSRIGVHWPCRTKEKTMESKVMYLITIKYQNADAATIFAECPCVGFCRDGFLGKKGREWLFFDVEGNVVAKRPKAELGRCDLSSDRWYFFCKPDHSVVAVDSTGREIGRPKPWIGFEHRYLFSFGISRITEIIRENI